MTEIRFKNKTTRIEACEIDAHGKIWKFKGDKAKEIAKMANSDKPDIKKFIENLPYSISKD